MKLIVIDLDRLKYKKSHKKNKRLSAILKFHDKCTKQAFDSLLKQLNENKVCTLTKEDFGKKVLLGLQDGDPHYLEAYQDYSDSIFHLKDDDLALKYENRMFRNLLNLGKIKYFRIGMVIKRDKAIKILQRMLGIA